MQSLKQLAGQTAVYGLSSIIGRFLNYLLTPLYTYQFIAQEYGVVTEMYAYVAFLVVLLTYGMETAFFRYVSKSDDTTEVYATALLPVFITGVIFATLCSVFADSIADLIQYADHPEYVIWFALIVSLDAISSIPLARLRQENKASRFAAVNLSSIALNIGLNLFFIAYCKVMFDSGNANALVNWCYDPSIGVGYIFISNLASSIFKVLLLSPFLKEVGKKIDRKLLKSMLAYGLPLLIAGLAGIANESLDRILLKYLLLESNSLEFTMTQVGIYGACYKVSILITLFIQAYRYAAEPFFFSKSKEENAQQLYAVLMRYFVIICLFMFLFLMINIDYVMLFVDEEYRAGVGVVPILLLANIFLGIYYNLSVWYKLTDKTLMGAYIAIVGAAITIGLNVVLIPQIGYMGSAWATLVCYFSMAFISFLLGRKYYPVPYEMGKITGYFFLALLIVFSLANLPSTALIKLILGNGILAILALALFLKERPKKA